MCKPTHHTRHSLPTKTIPVVPLVPHHAKWDPPHKPIRHYDSKEEATETTIDEQVSFSSVSSSSAEKFPSKDAPTEETTLNGVDPEFWELESGGIVTLPRHGAEKNPSIDIHTIDEGLDELFHMTHPSKRPLPSDDGYKTPLLTTLGNDQWEPPSPMPSAKRVSIELIPHSLDLPEL